MKSILFFLVLVFMIVPVNAVDWHDDSRLKRVQLNVNNSSVALTDYQIIKTVAHDSDMQSDFDDLLFYNESGGSIPYWIESKTDSVSAGVWLKIPSISTTTGATLWMYYENSSVSSASNGDDTFIQYRGLTTSNYLDSFIIPYSNYVYQSRIKSIGSNTLRFGVGIAASGGDETTNLLSYNSVNKMYIQSGTTAINEGGAFSYGVFYDTKITNDGTTVHGYRDGNEVLTGITTDLPISSMGLFVSASSTYEHKYAFVRKYTATEPTWGTDDEEESYEAPPPVLNGTYLYPNSTYSVGCYGRLISELVYETGFDFSDIDSCNALTTGDMEVLSTDDTNYIPSIDKDAAHDGYMYGNFSLPNVESVNFINVKTVHNRNFTNPVILGLFNVSTQKWYAVNNSSVEIIDVELTYNITGADIAKYSTLIDNTLNLSVSLNTNGDGNYDVFVDFVEVYIDYEEAPDITLGYVYNLTISNQNNITILQNDVDDLKDKVDNLYLFVLLCTVFLVAALRKRGDQ